MSVYHRQKWPARRLLGNSMTQFHEFLEEQLRDPVLKKEYDALEAEFSIMQALIDARKQSGLTQKQLAEHTGIARPTSAGWKGEPAIRH